MRLKIWLLASIAVAASACTTPRSQGTADSAPPTKPDPVVIIGPEFGLEADSLTSALAHFSEATGIETEYRGRRFATSDLDLAVEAGFPPDIAILAQPGRIADFVRSGFAVPLEQDVVDAATGAFETTLLELATVDDQLYGIPMKVDIKNLVWYSPEQFDRAGLEVPTTLNALLDLTDRIRMTGTAPWCVGMQAGDATGWVFTDWVEQATLSLHGPDVYRQWIRHELLFDSPEIRQAIELVADIWFTNGNVANGRAAIVDTQFGEAGLGLLDGDCYLHRQLGNYSLYYSNAGVTVGPDGDIDAFIFPNSHCGDRSVILGAGNFAVSFSDRPEAQETMRYLASEEFANDRIRFGSGGYLSAHTGQDLDLYATDIDRELAQMILASDAFLFDASDLMPGPVGSGRFWTAGVELVNEETSIDQLVQDIDRAWPAQDVRADSQPSVDVDVDDQTAKPCGSSDVD